MIRQSISDIAKACDGVITNKGNMEIIDKISTDSRTIRKGNLFIPLTGENFDGHTFIADAIEKGAGTVLVQENKMENVINADGINII
ncbi:MAG TPA: Mur ligase domain-containing protein, partial [Oscillospiraceae bacterium]|nr:Mur ligase domain-containing protein [Oscillospiraceae bacterium]